MLDILRYLAHLKTCCFFFFFFSAFLGSCSVVFLLASCVLRVAISGSSAPLVLRLRRVRVLLGSHAERVEERRMAGKKKQLHCASTLKYVTLHSRDQLINRPVLLVLWERGCAHFVSPHSTMAGIESRMDSAQTQQCTS